MVQPKSVGPASTAFSRDLGTRSTPRAKPRFTAEKIQISPEMVVVESSLNDLGEFLRDAIAKKVYAGESIENCLTLKQAIQTYNEHLQRNSQLQSDWNRYLKQLVVFKGRKSGDDVFKALDAKLGEAIKSWRSEILNSDGLHQPMGDNVVTAKLAAQSIDDIKFSLANDIEVVIQNSTSSILSQLAKLVELEVLSLIEWFSEGACTFKRYIRSLSVDIRSTEDRITGIYGVNGRWKKTVRTTQKGETSRMLSCHVQHLVNAKSYRIGESKILVPRDQKSFIGSIPEWLSPAVRIVEGTLIRETLIEKDLSVHEWELTEDKIQWHDDPAIVLGPFVLSAWGPNEIQAELAKQSEEAKLQGTQDSRKIAPIRILGLGEVMLAFFFCMGWRISVVNLLIGLISALLAFVTLGNRWKSDRQNYGSENVDDVSTPEDAFGYAGMLIGTAVFSSFLLSVGLVVGGVGCALIALLFLRLYISATFHWNPVDKTETRSD